MDDMQRKLDQLLVRSSGGGCPMCGLCTQHSSQLLAQTKLLEALERKVTELRTAVEQLAQGLDDKMSVPLVALQRRKSLPVRTSVEEVYVHLDRLRDQKISQHTLNVPCGKGQAGVLIEDTEDEIPREGSPLQNDHKVGKASSKQVTKDPLTVVQHLAPSLPGHVPPTTAKVDQAKLQVSQKSCKASGVAISPNVSASKTNTGPSKSHTPPKILLPSSKITPTPTITTPPSVTSTSKMPTPQSEMVTPSKKTTNSSTERRKPPPEELNPSSDVKPPSQTNSSPPSIIKPPHKDVPKIAATKTTTATSQNQTAVSGSNQEPTRTSDPKSPAVVTSTSSTHPKFNVTKFTAPASSTQLQKTKLGISVASQSVEGSLSKPSSQTSTHDTKSPQLNGTITKPVTSGDETLPLKTGLTTSVTQIPSSPPASSVIQGVPAGHNPPKVQGTGVPQSTSQSLAKPITNSQTKNSTLSPPKTLASPKTSAATPFLKQVYSCPDSLQSLQGPIGKAVGKSGTSSAGAAYPGSLTSAGIQIKISPATEKCTAQTKTSPKTCFKIIDDISPQPAPFPHRCVSLRSSPSCDFSIHTRDVLGGGRFGKVHKCTDIKSGLRLAAKILSGRSAKEKEMAVNEIEVMNQLNHPNILQLFDAFESKNQVVLILEYVEGGELLERIVDESCPLTEVDAMVYVKQICEGVQYMHHMYVLHLDLKPENILCVNRTSHQIKIIDFGLARRYKPREKLKVSFGTPEFLAPEVVNFDFVSFPTDMWTLGVVTYMLLSGLSPFLGDDDSETLNNVLTVNWYFDEETFEHVSDEAKDFVSNLLIRERSGRLSAAQCLKHPWLNNISEKAKRSNIVLKSQVLLRKYMARRLWKKNYIAIAAANRFKKIGSSGSLTSLGV